MRRQIRTFALAGLIVVTGAPSTAAQHLGFTAGKTNSDVVELGDGGGSLSYPDREAYMVGVTYRRRLLPGVTLQHEALLIQRGWSERSHPTLTMTYLDIPLLFRVGALSTSGWPLRPTFTIGPSFNFALSCSVSNTDIAGKEGSGCGDQAVVFSSHKESYRVNRFETAVVAGLGAEVRLPGGTIVGVEGRFEGGITRVRPQSNSHNTVGMILISVVPNFASIGAAPSQP